MKDYLEKLDISIQKYFKILSDEFPEFLYDYINTPEIQHFDFKKKKKGARNDKKTYF